MSVPRLVLVTDRYATRGRDLVAVVVAALGAGLPAVQLRDKELSGRELFALAERLRRETARTGALLFVNDRIDIALAVGADGVHLGDGSVPVEVARSLVPPACQIGVSTHSAAELGALVGASFAFFGPVFATPSKAAYGPPQGEVKLREALRTAHVPILAIGGVGAAEVPTLRVLGVAGVAVVRAILAADDPAAATHALVGALG